MHVHRILFFAFFSYSLASFSWVDNGHRLVAEIAFQQLSMETKKNLAALLNMGQNKSIETLSSEDFQKASLLADSLRYLNNAFNSWHYIDYPINADIQTKVKPPEKENVVWALEQCDSTLKKFHEAKNPLPNFRVPTAFMLFMFIHLVADIHQPLHCAERYSEKRPRGDKGGNLYSILIEQKPINLHLLWDCGVGFLCNPLLDKNHNQFSKEKIKQLAAELQKEFPKNTLSKELAKRSYKDWAKESYDLAVSQVYTLPEHQEISPSYKDKGQKSVKKRIVLAGYRLAQKLEGLLGKTAKSSAT